VVWDGSGAPKATPAAIVDLLNSNITAALADPQVKARITDLGGEIVPMTPQQFGKFVADETDKWAKVVKFAGITAN
jgi:tripartite-type tricarboxylate transporter receptor subunit TctC